MVSNIFGASIREEFTDVTYFDHANSDSAHWDTSTGRLKPTAFEDKNNGGNLFDDEIDFGDGSDGACVFSTFTNPIDTDVKATYNCTSLNLYSGENLTVIGSNQLFIRVTGNTRIVGSITANGGDGQDAFDAGNASAQDNGGAGVAGGSDGGDTRARNDGNDGDEPAGGMGGGGGVSDGDGATHLSGGGGGGGHGLGSGGTLCPAAAGTQGNVSGGAGGSAGSDNFKQDDFGTGDFQGGAGGGGGGGADSSWTSGGVFIPGGSGGGGGGAIAIFTGGTLEISGTVSANGGDGGDANGGPDIGDGAGAGGGGSGGAIWLHSSNGITISGTVEARGGQGGSTSFPGFGEGGDGACGLIRIGDPDQVVAGAGTTFPPAQAPEGTDDFSNSSYSEDNITILSKAYDLGTGGPFVHSAPTTGQDTTNGTVSYRVSGSNTPVGGFIPFVALGSIASINAFRYVRFEVQIDRNDVDGVADSPPSVDFFQWNYDTGPILSIDTATHDFGNANPGGNTSTIDITLTNSGNSNATGCTAPKLVGANPDNFEITADTCSTNNLNSGGSTCTVTIRGTPQILGTHTATLVRNCTLGGEVSTNANGLQVTGAVGPNVNISAATHDFGNQLINTNSSGFTFTYTNSGGADATGCSAPVLGGTNSGEFNIQTDNCGTNNLASGGGSCTVIVRGRPTSNGLKQATLSRACTVGGTVSTTADGIDVTGISPNIGISAATHDFGNQLINTNSSGFTFTYTNSGGADATGCSAPVLGGTNSGEFNIQTDNCGTNNLASGGGSCTVIVRGRPTSNGLKQATLSRACTVGGTVSTTADGIDVTGISPNIGISAATHDFGNQPINTNTTGFTFTYTNSGTADATGCSAPTLGGTNSGDFNIQTDNCGTNNLASGGGSCTVIVRGHPTSVGLKQATLSRACTVGGTVSTTADGIDVTGTVAPNVGISAATHDFGNQLINTNSSGFTFTYTNSGTADATGCSAPTLGGTNSGEFNIQTDNCGTNNLASGGGSCTVIVRGRPTSNGLKQATLSRACTVGGTVSTTADGIDVTGISPNIGISAATHDFGNQLINTNSSGFTFTYTNSGTADATGCSAPTLGGTNSGEFNIQTDNCGTNNLASGGGSCTVIVRGRPTSVGLKQATLSRACTVGGTVSTTADGIDVTGITPSVAVAPLTNDFGVQAVNTNTAGAVFTFTNSGGADATGCSAPTLAGANPGEFNIAADTCGTNNLASGGGTCTVTVRGHPTTNGLKEATLTRTCTVGGTASTTANELEVTGTGGVDPIVEVNTFSGTIKGACGSVALIDSKENQKQRRNFFFSLFLSFLIPICFKYAFKLSHLLG